MLACVDDASHFSWADQSHKLYLKVLLQVIFCPVAKKLVRHLLSQSSHMRVV